MGSKSLTGKKDFDVIIVGGGPGGLAVGAMLAKEGVRTAIIEKDPVVGGRYRSIDFHGCRVDCAVHFLVTLFGSPKKSYTYKLFAHLGLPLEYKLVQWPIALVSKETPGQLSTFAMDLKLGVDNFYEFFAFATGMQMDDSVKKELMKLATITSDMSEDECRQVTNVCFADWIEKNIEDPMAKAVLYGMEPVVGAPIKDMSFGFIANAWSAFPRVGGVVTYYPRRGTLEDAIIAPLAKYITNHGGKIITHTTARSIVVEDGKVKGVAVHDEHKRFMLEEYSAPVVVCAMPIFQAVEQHILGSELLTDDWIEAIRLIGSRAVHDLSGFYLLRKDVLPRKGFGWIHVFDVDYGLPTYVGDWALGSFTNATEPPGKQLVCSYISGSSELTHFGLTAPMEKVRQANKMFKDAMEKAFPGFNKAIEHEGLNVQLSHGRYAYGPVPVEVNIQSPNIQGLYFAGDSIWNVGQPASEKVFQIAFPLCERIVKQLRFLEQLRSISVSTRTGRSAAKIVRGRGGKHAQTSKSKPVPGRGKR